MRTASGITAGKMMCFYPFEAGFPIARRSSVDLGTPAQLHAACDCRHCKVESIFAKACPAFSLLGIHLLLGIASGYC